MKKKILKITCIFLLMAVTTFVIFLLCFFQEIRTIKCLKTYDVKDLYSLNYYADYGFDEFIKVGKKNISVRLRCRIFRIGRDNTDPPYV